MMILRRLLPESRSGRRRQRRHRRRLDGGLRRSRTVPIPTVVGKFGLAASCVLLSSVGCDTQEKQRPPERVRVPNVIGLAENAALRRITRAELCVQDISYLPRAAKAEVVIDQWPKPRALVPRKLRMALFMPEGAAGAGIWMVGQLRSLGDCPPTHYVRAFPAAGQTP